MFYLNNIEYLLHIDKFLKNSLEKTIHIKFLKSNLSMKLTINLLIENS